MLEQLSYSGDIINKMMEIGFKINFEVNKELKRKKLEICFAHCQFFYTLYNNQTPISMINMAYLLGRSRSDITALTNQMIIDGYIIRKPSTEDHRKKHLHLTMKALKLVPIITNIYQNIQTRMENIISPEKLWEMRNSLMLLNDSFHKA